MLIVRKKNIIRFLSLLLGALLIILGLFFRGYTIENQRKKEKIKQLSSFYTSVCTSLDNICTYFDEDLFSGNKQLASRKIFSNCETAKNSLYYCESDMPNTLSWFSSLSEYSETDMADPSLNEYYAKTADGARDLFVSLCNNVSDTSKITVIETLLDNKDSSYYNTKLMEMNNDYSLLNNFLESDRADLTDYAKKILNFPISPKKTKGNYSAPPLFVYSSKNSYAQIFSSGRFLKRMSVEETSTVDHTPKNPIDILADEYLGQYAPYAKNCEKVYSYKNNALVYYIYCPIIQQKEISFTDHTESIKLAVSISDGKLMAFDASHYMKTHSSKEYPDIPDFKAQTATQNINGRQALSNRIIYTEKGFIFYYKYKKPDNTPVYHVYDQNKNLTIYNEKELMLASGVI